ncbi:SET domain-containing protein 5 [Colletotrichum tropicale]|nr:SET domain-containing protein 5 [Colletotrichum tropicale]
MPYKLLTPINDVSLCPLSHNETQFDLPILPPNHSSPRQSVCTWSDDHEKEYCLFADTHFNHGKGISMITTPERARQIFTSIKSISNHHSLVPEPLIIQEPPILFLDRNWINAFSSEDTRTAMQTLAVEELPEPTRQTFFELYAGPFEKNLTQRMWTNGYGVAGGPTLSWPGLDDESDLGMIAVHANISKINHSCRPNAASQWDWDVLAHRLYAARDIAAYEEITISYINPIQSRKDRQQYAKNILGFECACSQCQAASKFSDLSDDRINEILLLESYLESRHIAPAEPTAMAELLVSLYKQEGLDSFICKAYAIAAREWNGAGYEYQAREMAYESVKAGLIAGSGTGLDDYVNEMEELLDGARKHWSWRYRLHS